MLFAVGLFSTHITVSIFSQRKNSNHIGIGVRHPRHVCPSPKRESGESGVRISQYHYDSNWHDVGQTMPSQNRKEDSSRNEITTSFLCFSYTATTPTNKIKSFFSILFFPRNIGTTRSTTSSNYCWRNSQLSTSVSQSCSLVKQTKWSERNCANQKTNKPNHGIITDWWKVYRTTMYGYGGKGGPTKNIPISFVRYSRRK